MARQYPQERKASIINKMLPPQSMTIPEIAQLENIPLGTLYTWKQQYLKNNSKETPLMASSHIQWTAEQQLAVIIETSRLSEQELSEYCRKKGLYSLEIEEWKSTFIKNAKHQKVLNKEDKEQIRQLRNDNKILTKELKRKEKALAEAAALLVLRKKWDALWEESEVE